MKYILKKRLLWLFFFFVIGALHAQNKIRIGIDNNYPPYEFTDSKGTPTGFNVDLIKSILDEYGYSYVFIAKPWNETYAEFKDKKIDILSMLFSDERNALYNLSIPHNMVTYCVFHNIDNINEINDINNNRKIIVIKDDVMHELLKHQINDSNITTVNNAEEALKLVNERNSEIALLPKLQGLFLINKFKYDEISTSNNILYSQKYCFAVNKDKPDLIYNLNEGLSIAKENNVYNKLYEKWFEHLELAKISYSRLFKDYFVVFIILFIILLIVIFWNLTLKKYVKKRTQELNAEFLARERSEMAIIESEERFRTLTENSPAAIFIFNQKKIFFINHAACDISDCNKEELLKMSFIDLLSDEKDKKLIADFFDNIRKNKTDCTRFDIIIKSKKDEEHWVNLSLVKSYFKAEPVVIATAFDVTDRHEYEVEITEGKRMYSNLLDNLPGLVYQCKNDNDWTMIFVSVGCTKLTGYKPEEIIDNTKISYNDIIHPDDRQYVWEFIQRNIDQNTSFTIEYRIITKSNDVKWVWEQGKFITTSEETILEGYIVDITERINIKKELNKEKQQYKTMLQSIGDGVISTDIDGRITMLNKVAEKLTGWDQTEAMGKPLGEVFNIINEQTREACFNPVKKVLETEMIVGLANHTILISKNGTEYIISDSAAPIKNEEGKITGVILVFSDNTANKRAEDTIKESEANLKATFNAIPDLIFRNNAEGYFTDFHAGNEQVLLIEPSKIIGSHISDLFDEKFSANIIKALKNCLDSGEAQNIEYFFDTPEGRQFYDAKIVKYNKNETLALCRDITIRKRNEEEINKNYKIQKIIADISLLLNSAAAPDVLFNETLEIIGKNLNVSRAYIFENFDNNKFCRNTYEWCNENISKEKDNLQNVNHNEHSKFIKTLLSENIVISNSIHNDFNGEFLQNLISQNIKSLICLPLFVKNTFFGFIGFDNCFEERIWSNYEIELFKTLSVLISNTFEREISTKIIEEDREQLETTLYSIGDGVIVTDNNGKIILINKVAKKLTSFAKEEALGMEISQVLNIVSIDSRIPQPSPVEKVIETGKGTTFENKVLLLAKDGKEYIISENASPIKDRKRKIMGVVVVFKDITDQKRKEDAIKQSEENYRRLFDSANDVIFILKNDKIINCNEKTLSSFGYTKEEIINKTPDIISPQYQPDGIPSKEKAAFYINKAYEGEPIYFEWNHQRKDGQIINCEISLNRLELESETHLQAIVRDITVRKEFEKALSESEEKYKTLVEKANDGIAIVQDNNFLYVNNKLVELTGYKIEEIIDKPFLDFIHPDYHELIISYNKARILKSENIPSIYEIKAIHKSGEILDVELNSNYVNYYGKPAAMVIVRDISERKKNEEKLKLFKVTIENSTDAIGMSTPDGIHYYQNEAFDNLFGNLAHNSVESIYKYESDKKTVFDTMMHGHQFIGEIEMYSKDRKTLNVLLRAYPIFDTNGKISNLVGIHTDITDKKQIENALQKSEEKFRMLLDFAVDAFFQGDSIGNLITVNDAAVLLTGYSRDELLKLNIKDLFHEDALNKNPLLYSRLNENIILKAEREITRKDGQIIPIEMNSRKMPDGTYQSFFRDITERKKSDSALRESEEKYRIIVDYSPDAIIVHSFGKIVFANEAAYKMVGAQTPDQIIGINALNFVHNDYKELVVQRIKRMNETNKPESSMEEKFLKLSGEAFDVEVLAIPIEYMGKQAVQTIIRDITERKEAQKALIQSEEKYRLLFENITQGFALHEIILNENGKPIDYRYLTVNPAFGQLTGIDVKKIPGKRVKEIIPDIESYWIDVYGEVSLTGKAIHYENYSAALEKYYDTWVFSPNKGQFAVIFSDITERRKAEDALRALLEISQMGEKELKEITDFTLEKCTQLTMSEIAFLAFINEDGTKMRLHSFSKEVYLNEGVNPDLNFDLTTESLFSGAIHSKKAVIINDYKSFAHKKQLPLWHINIERVLIVPIEENGKVVAISTVANKRTNYDETDIHQLTLIIDRLWKTVQSKAYNESITKLNSELIDKNKEMEQFVYVTSHDLRSPLVNIQGFTKELTNSYKSIKEILSTENEIASVKEKILNIYKEDIDESLGYIDLSARKMDTLLNGLLKLSRMGRITVNIKPVKMNIIVKEIINSFEFQIMKKNIEISLEKLDDCQADEVLINQVFSNIIDNAIKYNDKEKGHIKISSNLNDKKVIYRIEDNGPGIQEKYYQKIFEIFQRLNTSVSGEGLGLSIVNKIIEKHNGKIWIESKINKGTVFFIELLH